MIVLSLLGLATIASVAPGLFLVQLLFILMGVAAYWVFASIDYHLYGPFAKHIYIVSLLALGTTLLFGITSRGSVRWIPVGPVNLQFSEFLKPFLIVVLASLLIQNLTDPKKVFLSVLWQIPILFLLFKQPDLGSTAIYLTAFTFMIFISGVNWRTLTGFLAAVAVALPAGWNFLAGYQKDRIMTFLNPRSDLLGTSYNAVQSIITVGSGMLFGTGLGRGTQTHLFFLPEKHTDFIFASFAEEFGFAGSSFLLTAYFILIFRCLWIFRTTADPLGRLIAGGVMMFFLAQGVINIGMNIGLLPVTGITLPLVSYGGSSVLSSLISLGIMTNICRSQTRKILFS